MKDLAIAVVYSVAIIAVAFAFGVSVRACQAYNVSVIERNGAAVARGCSVVNDSTVICK